MTTKRANWLFLTIILVHIGVVLFLRFGGSRISIDMVTNFLLSEGILMIPTALFLFAFARKDRQRQPAGQQGVEAAKPGALGTFEAAAFHKVKISTFLMIALSTFLIMPLVAVLNALSMLFADNVMESLRGNIVDTSFPAMLLMVGIVGPFCEEFVFRGVIYRSYRKNEWDQSSGCYGNNLRSGISEILLSALLFGLMHMNFNQMIYAFAMGIFLALLVEAAGSLWASVFCHMFFNSVEVVLMYVSDRLTDSIYEQTAVAAELTTQQLLAALAFYLIIAAVTTPIAGCIVVWIAKNEGRQQPFSALFFRQKRQDAPGMQNGQEPYYLLSVPLIVAIVLCLGYMSLEFFFW